MSTTHAKAAKAFLSDKVNAEWHDKTIIYGACETRPTLTCYP